MPVIQSRPTHRLFADIESQRADQMQRRIGIDTQSADGTGVVGDLGVDEDDVKQGAVLYVNGES